MSLLSSNVVNYLGTFPHNRTRIHHAPCHASLTLRAVWRYLQEAGFGNAALQLSRCWIRDPETLPFARNVEPHTLIRILQDGMCFDDLQAEATNVRLHASTLGAC